MASKNDEAERAEAELAEAIEKLAEQRLLLREANARLAERLKADHALLQDLEQRVTALEKKRV